MRIYTNKVEAQTEAARLATAGHTVAVVQTMIKRMPAPFRNVVGWKIMEVTA